MLNYETAKQNVFATGVVPDGYFGATRNVKFSFDQASGQTVTVTDRGCFHAGLPPAIDTTEALWLLRNHPSSRASNVRPA